MSTFAPLAPFAPPAGPVNPPIAHPVAPPAVGPLAPATLAPAAINAPIAAPSNLDLQANLGSREILNPMAPWADVIQPPNFGQPQTPWLSNIDGAGYTLSNANFINVTLNGTPLTNVFTLQGTVDTSTDLPANARPGDTYITADSGSLWTWDGSNWVDLGPANSDLQTPWTPFTGGIFYNGGAVLVGQTSRISATATLEVTDKFPGQATVSSPNLTTPAGAFRFVSWTSILEMAGSYGTGSFWIQAKNGQTPGNAYALSLNPLGGNVTVGAQNLSAAFGVRGYQVNQYAFPDPSRFYEPGTFQFEQFYGAALLCIGNGFGPGQSYANPWIQVKSAGSPSNGGPLSINPIGGYVSIGGSTRGQFPLDVTGDVNSSGCYRVAGVPFACGSAGQITLSNISTINGTAPGGGGGPTTQGNYGDASGTAAREPNVNYQNNTGKAIFMTVVVQSYADETAEIYIFTDSTANPQICVAHDEAGPVSGGGLAYACVTAVVLPGNFYRVVLGSNAGFTPNWTEWY